MKWFITGLQPLPVHFSCTATDIQLEASYHFFLHIFFPSFMCSSKSVKKCSVLSYRLIFHHLLLVTAQTFINLCLPSTFHALSFPLAFYSWPRHPFLSGARSTCPSSADFNQVGRSVPICTCLAFYIPGCSPCGRPDSYIEQWALPPPAWPMCSQ